MSFRLNIDEYRSRPELEAADTGGSRRKFRYSTAFLAIAFATGLIAYDLTRPQSLARGVLLPEATRAIARINYTFQIW